MNESSSTLISWNEPWFFLVRSRGGWDWCKRIFIVIVFAIVMILLAFFKGWVAQGLIEVITLSIAVGIIAALSLDVDNIQRNVNIKEERIILKRAVGWGWAGLIPLNIDLDLIEQIQLKRPDEWGKSYAGMVIFIEGHILLYGIPKAVSLQNLADILHRLGVSVELID
ncbi:hypothetical protein [Gimesia aquarii]|uniref:DUF5673 domain-containing protein n=1 Tax=Gimesia aquarii TaxID=2527964 RepID=A0A517WQ85_9PLAN|nr:hypothetical protein [Gimesia aquarii]QDU07421.1 hypothetical protein V202x_07740 [Gimesia aquarii]